MNELAAIVAQHLAVAAVRLFALTAQAVAEQLSPMTVFVTLCAAVTTLFGALLVLFKHMIDNDKRKTDVLERQHDVLSQWFATADKRLDRILDKVSEK